MQVTADPQSCRSLTPPANGSIGRGRGLGSLFACKPNTCVDPGRATDRMSFASMGKRVRGTIVQASHLPSVGSRLATFRVSVRGCSHADSSIALGKGELPLLLFQLRSLRKRRAHSHAHRPRTPFARRRSVRPCQTRPESNGPENRTLTGDTPFIQVFTGNSLPAGRFDGIRLTESAPANSHRFARSQGRAANACPFTPPRGADGFRDQSFREAR